MKLRAVLLVVVIALASSTEAISQKGDKRSLVLKTSITSPLGLIRSGTLGLEIPIGKQWSTELHIGLTSGALGAWDGTHAPAFAVMGYKYIQVRDWNHPLRLGVDMSYRKMVLWGYHFPCMGWIEEGSSTWTNAKYNCFWRPRDTFDHNQEHWRLLVTVGKRIRDKTFIWEVDLGIGFEYVTTTRIGRQEAIPYPGAVEPWHPREWKSNPILLPVGHHWIPAIKLDVKFGAELTNRD